MVFHLLAVNQAAAVPGPEPLAELARLAQRFFFLLLGGQGEKAGQEPFGLVAAEDYTEGPVSRITPSSEEISTSFSMISMEVLITTTPTGVSSGGA